MLTRLPASDQRELEGHIQVFIEEKRFEVRVGFQITDDDIQNSTTNSSIFIGRTR